MVMKMLSKEKCEKALNSFCDSCKYGYDCKIMKKYNGCVQINTLNQLIKEHFELLEKIEWVKEEMTEPVFDLVFGTQEFFHNWYQGIQMYSVENAILQRKVNGYENPQPYKFEELKKGMWIWDDKGLYCFECNPAISTDMAQCVTYNAFWYNCGEDKEFFEEYDEFEEGRFYPVTKALEYQK